MRAEAAPQTGGSPDLDVLWTELREWPGYYVESIRPGSSWGSRDREGQYKPDGGWFWECMSASWCVAVQAEGWEPRDRWLMWGSSIADAAEKLVTAMRQAREYPHIMHMGWYAEGYFQRGCAECEREAVTLFADRELDWREAS